MKKLERPGLKNVKKKSQNLPEGLWKKCSNCEEILQVSRLEANQFVCPFCEHHYRVSAVLRIEQLVDEGSFKIFPTYYESLNPLEFQDKKDYADRLAQAKEKKKNRAQELNKPLEELSESIVSGEGLINGVPVVVSVMDFFFMGGSMGSVCGELITQAFEKALEKRIPCVLVTSSGGARMQEGILSLMQMAKTTSVRSLMRRAGVPLIVVLTDPTTGGCAASFAMQGDIQLAEPKALVGFAGPRVIEQTIRQSLPKELQKSEFLQKTGFVDRIVHRKDLRDELAFFCKFLTNNSKDKSKQISNLNPELKKSLSASSTSTKRTSNERS